MVGYCSAEGLLELVAEMQASAASGNCQPSEEERSMTFAKVSLGLRPCRRCHVPSAGGERQYGRGVVFRLPSFGQESDRVATAR